MNVSNQLLLLKRAIYDNIFEAKQHNIIKLHWDLLYK
jgi:hypothetical protein